MRSLTAPAASPATEHAAAHFDFSPPLRDLTIRPGESVEGCDRRDCGISLPEGDHAEVKPLAAELIAASRGGVSAGGDSIEQNEPGSRAPMAKVESFDGLGFGFTGPQGAAKLRNPSDNSLAIGPNHIVQIVNSRMAIYSKKGAQFGQTGKVLYGPVRTNTIFEGFGGQCEIQTSGDSVVRYDQLADRWLYVLPIFKRPAGDPKGPFYMCYAVSAGPDPLGPYHRYAFERPLFPDYPRPAIWPDGYYVPTSTGDEVIEKHACVADRQKMLKGLPATEQCVIIEGVNFLNNADIEGQGLPPPGAPNIMLAAGGTQLKKVLEDDGIYAYQFHVDWNDEGNTKVSGPTKISVAPYHYLCDGQLTKCVSQPGTDVRLDAQGDKLMQRLVYRKLGQYETLAVVHSVDTKASGGGVRWYEFRLDANRNPQLFQQGTYAPDKFYRWMGSIAVDHQGNIGVGYSFGGPPNFPGQRFAGRLASDKPGSLTFRETILAEGEAPQTTTLRWQDYTTTAMDPSDDCSFWYVGDYLKRGADAYSTRIGAFRMPGCLQGTIAGTAYYDLNHDGRRQIGEPGIAHLAIQFSGPASGSVLTDEQGAFKLSVPADTAYKDSTYRVSQQPSSKFWKRTGVAGLRQAAAVSAPNGTAYTVHFAEQRELQGIDFGSACTVRNRGGKEVRFWSKKGSVLPEEAWQTVLNSRLYLVASDGFRFTVPSDDSGTDQLKRFLQAAGAKGLSALSAQMAAVQLNIIAGSQDGKATLYDPVANDWAQIEEVLERASRLIRAGAKEDAEFRQIIRYRKVLEDLNRNRLDITPSRPEDCGPTE